MGITLRKLTLFILLSTTNKLTFNNPIISSFNIYLNIIQKAKKKK